MNAELISYLEQQKSERAAVLAKRDSIEARKKQLFDELEKADAELAALSDKSTITAECDKLDKWIDELKGKSSNNAPTNEAANDTVVIATAPAVSSATANG